LYIGGTVRFVIINTISSSKQVTVRIFKKVSEQQYLTVLCRYRSYAVSQTSIYRGFILIRWYVLNVLQTFLKFPAVRTICSYVDMNDIPYLDYSSRSKKEGVSQEDKMVIVVVKK
jgi:hypothetical protein